MAERTSDPVALCIATANGTLRRKAADVLSRSSYQVLEAKSLAELEEHARAHSLALAVVDPRLPGLGESPLAVLRAEAALHRCPLLLLSEVDRKALQARRPDPDLVDLMVRVNAQLAGNEQLALLHRVSETLSASPDMEPTMKAVLAAVAGVLPFDTGTLFLLDKLGRLQVRAAWGYDVAMNKLRSFEVGEGVVGWVVANRVPSIVGDSDLDRRFEPLEGGRSSRSMLAVPIMVGDRVLGALTLVRRAPAEQFTDLELILVATVGNSAAVALENARLYEQERALALRLEDLNQLYGKEAEILEKLGEYDRLYTSVVATVSHELKTPLMGIRGFAQMIRDGDVDGADARDFASEIHENAVRLSSYAERILQEDAVHHGRLRLDIREVRLRQLVAQVVRSLRATVSNRHRLINDVTDEIPLVKGDAEKINQILVNLINNAIKYSPDGGEVRISAQTRGKEVELSVED
ncbi:MAG TPA: GAF domain-containing protein, partial [Candidatus Dormibacteraeota bacterium]|nr:GAF domain-containing protein [Candidatus Dormibacteraeota bacterium]